MVRLRLEVVAATLAVIAPAAWLSAQSFAWQTGAEKETPAVRYEYPKQVQVAAGRAATVQMHFRIRDGLHINSHSPLQKSLIRTELIVAEPAGVKVASVDFPSGAEYSTTAFPKEKLSVYTGEVVLEAHLLAQPGPHLVEAALRYQACDANSCYPPKKAPVALSVVAK